MNFLGNTISSAVIRIFLVVIYFLGGYMGFRGDYTGFLGGYTDLLGGHMDFLVASGNSKSRYNH
jgi:hypothetical protein